MSSSRPIAAFRRTKIIVTLGPATESEAMLETLLRGGADIVRLNMAHATHEWTRTTIQRIREISKRVEREVAIMMDIKGPEIRTGDLEHPIELKAGEVFDFTVKPGARAGEPNLEEVRSVDVNYKGLVKDIAVGDTVLVDNGLIQLEVLEKREAKIRCRVLVPGELKSRRHINLPGVTVNLPAFTEKDRRDTLVGIEEGIDFVALSFVRKADDVETLREFLRAHNSSAQIIAKIEDQSAVANLEEIVRASDALMIARGDLGIECPLEELPIIQRRAGEICFNYGRPVIVATHMLESMIANPVPTRAEITDVANAVFERADCVMLSGETTIGKFPAECVEVLNRIAVRIEGLPSPIFLEPRYLDGDKVKLLQSAVQLANELDDCAILTFTRRGFMAAGLAAMRPHLAPIFAFTPSIQTLRQLRILRGVEPFFMQLDSDPDLTIGRAIGFLQREGRIKDGDKLVIATDILSANRLVDSVQLRTVK